MKHLLAKFMLSNSLDTGRALSPFWRRTLSGTPELGEFDRAARQLDQLLKPDPDRTSIQAPPGLHATIMHAVRGTPPPVFRRERLPWLRTATAMRRWAFASALVVLLAAGVWLLLGRQGLVPSRPPASPPSAAAGWPRESPLPSAWGLVAEFAVNTPALLTQPLLAQFEHLSEDAREAAQFLQASLP